MSFKTIRKDRLSDKIALEIIRQIQSGELKPGDKLPPENQLAELMGVSRGILREALTILHTRGYIRKKPKDGTYINEELSDKPLNGKVMSALKKGSYLELLEMRECLEQKTAEKAIQISTDEEIDELIEQLELGEGDKIHNDIDQYFHYRLAELSGNSMFMSFINMYYDLISEIASESRKNIERRDEIKSEHLEIAYAIKERNSKKAIEAVSKHMSKVIASVEQITPD